MVRSAHGNHQPLGHKRHEGPSGLKMNIFFRRPFSGNADRYDYGTTMIIYYDDQFAAAAAKLHDALGLGEVSKGSTATDTEDVTVILGRDAIAKYGGTGG